MRQYMLSQTQADYMLCLDADMTYDSKVAEILLQEIQGYDMVHSGCALREFGMALSGTGCTLITRDVLKRLVFQCREFKNGDTMPEDLMLEIDMFRLRCKVKRGFFLSNCHYVNETEAACIEPQPVGITRRMLNAPLFRYIILSASLLIRRNIPWRLKCLINKAAGGKW